MKKSSPKIITHRLAVGIILLILLSSLATDNRAFASPQFSESNDRTQQATRGETRELKLGEPIERELSGGAAHSYSLLLIKGQFLKVVVEQKAIDVVVRLFNP